MFNKSNPVQSSPIQFNPYLTIWRLAWKKLEEVSICMVTLAALVTKTKTSFLLGSRRRSCCPSWWTELNDEKAKRSQTSRKSAKRMRDFPVGEGRGTVGRGPWGKNLPCQWTPPLPSRVVLSMIWNVLAENQKLKIDFNFQFSSFWLASETQRLSLCTDCNIVGDTK